jgi:PAS domain S-box-containing protein
MSLKYTPYLVPLFTAAIVSIILAIYGWRRRHAPGAIPFALLMISVAQWSLAYAFELGSADLQTKILWAHIKYLGVVIVPAAWLLFALKYTGHELRLTVRKISLLLAVEPLVTLLLVWTNHLHGLIWSTIGLDSSGLLSVRVSTHGAWFWVHALYSYLLLLLGTILIIVALIRSPHLYRGQTVGLLIGVLAPWVGNALYILDSGPFPNLDLTSFAFTLTGLGFSWSLFGFRLLDIVPAAHETVFKSMSDAVIIMDAQNRIVDLNPATQRILGRPASESIGQQAEKGLSGWPALVEHCRNMTEMHSEIVSDENGRKRYFDLSISPLRDKHDFLTGQVVVLRDITERKQAEEILQNAHDELEKQVEGRTAELERVNKQLKKEIEERVWAEGELKESLKLIGRAKREWESTTDSLPQLICLLDNRGTILRTNRMVEKWNLGKVQNVKGRKVHELFHPGCTDPGCYLENFWSHAWKELAKGQPAECEADDKIIKRHLHYQVRPILPQKYAKDEEISSYAVTIVNDITESKRAEREKVVLEEQLRQSQKMEAIGRLAGGIAHDFNNLLTPIVGYSQLAMRSLSPSDPMRNYLSEIEKAAERAATLIRQLLTFSRRQPLKPQVLNINNVLIDMDKMLRRIIGEHIELVTLPASDLGSVKVDPSQFEQVLVNLTINARDAMLNGGKLILETSNVSFDSDYIHRHTDISPGNYVMVAVSDTGCGMQQEIRERIFEPFFTTKGKTGGTGLGLSTVHGIVKDSRGYILVYSELDKGTTFKIYLPRIEEEAAAPPPRDDIGYLPKGDETILLVEDEESVRNLTAHVLREQGYAVLEAANGSEAMNVAGDHAAEKIHLLLTDVVMPQMGGRELAKRLKVIRPTTKILFTSGYPDSTIIYQGLLDPDVDFIAKPISPSTLARKVREVLDK